MLAHFMAGIDDDSECSDCFREVGLTLFDAIHDAKETGLHAQLFEGRMQ
jgi:hypothetical protein